MLVRIVMGSASDAQIAEKTCQYLKKFDIPYEVSVISAHRSLGDLVELVERGDASLYIGIAGKAAHLSGVMAGLTTKPVIGVPASGSQLDGMDALLSTVQMPTGVPVATVAIDGGANAGILAAQILSLADADLAKRLETFKEEMAQGVRDMNQDPKVRDL